MQLDKGETKEGGIQIEQAKGEIPPPIKEGEEKPPEEVERPKPPLGTMPLQPAVIRLTFRVPGELLAWRTKWDGWKLSDQDLEDIVEVYQQLGIELDVRLQALILPVVVYGEKYVGYEMWRRKGQPGLEEKEVGSAHPLEGKKE